MCVLALGCGQEPRRGLLAQTTEVHEPVHQGREAHAELAGPVVRWRSACVLDRLRTQALEQRFSGKQEGTRKAVRELLVSLLEIRRKRSTGGRERAPGQEMEKLMGEAEGLPLDGLVLVDQDRMPCSPLVAAPEPP